MQRASPTLLQFPGNRYAHDRRANPDEMFGIGEIYPESYRLQHRAGSPQSFGSRLERSSPSLLEIGHHQPVVRSIVARCCPPRSTARLPQLTPPFLAPCGRRVFAETCAIARLPESKACTSMTESAGAKPK